jgi:hypothetical protein
MQLARRRLRLARYSIGAAAIGAFATFGLAVRAAHPATRTGSAPVANAATSSSDDAASAFGGGGVISPATQATPPAVQSSGS